MWNRTRGLFFLPLSLCVVSCSGATGRLPDAQGESSTSGGSSGSLGSGAGSSGLASDQDADVTMLADATSPADASDAGQAEAEAAPNDPCAGTIVCDDFESTAPGQPPRASLWAINPPDCGPMRGTAVVDSTQAHSGKHSVKVQNNFGPNAAPPQYCDHVFFSNASAFASVGSQVYARFYMYLGNTVDPDPGSHVTFATMTDAMNGGDQLRVGFATGVFVWNRKSDDAYLPELDTGNGAINAQASLAPTTATWTCVEIHIDQSAGTIDTWIDGTEYPGLAETGTPVADVSTVWLGGGHATWRPQLTNFGLGWETYFDNASDAMTVWFDDVAIASHRIGCIGP